MCETRCYRVQSIFISRVRGFKFFFNIIYVYGSGPDRICIIPGHDPNPFRVFLLKPNPPHLLHGSGKTRPIRVGSDWIPAGWAYFAIPNPRLHIYVEKCWRHTLLHIFVPQLAIWRVVVGQSVLVGHVGIHSNQPELAMWRVVSQNCAKVCLQHFSIYVLYCPIVGPDLCPITFTSQALVFIIIFFSFFVFISIDSMILSSILFWYEGWVIRLRLTLIVKR